MPMKHNLLQDYRLKNLLRGAQANTDAHVRQATINNARRIMNPSEATKFATLMCQSDLDESYFGPAFPYSVTTIYRAPIRKAISLNTECAIQSARIRYHLQRLEDASISLGRINTAILFGDLSEACSICTAFLNEFGYSATLARKVIYINLLATSNNNEHKNSQYKTLASELLQPFFRKRHHDFMPSSST